MCDGNCMFILGNNVTKKPFRSGPDQEAAAQLIQTIQNKTTTTITKKNVLKRRVFIS